MTTLPYIIFLAVAYGLIIYYSYDNARLREALSERKQNETRLHAQLVMTGLAVSLICQDVEAEMQRDSFSRYVDGPTILRRLNMLFPNREPSPPAVAEEESEEESDRQTSEIPSHHQNGDESLDYGTDDRGA